ncbi:MAG: hypothetical protein P4L36_18895 [Holophaga sp.]|nr:hypothetical protein [Holophaga sp.]
MTRIRRWAVLGTILFTGCTPPLAYTTSYLFPVQGPLSTRKPIPVIPATVGHDSTERFAGVTQGDISFVLPGGESFQGQWTRQPYINSDPNALADLRATDIVSAWDAVYGDGYYQATVLGSLIHARATLKGSKGTNIQIEFNSSVPWPTRGVARDDQGNIYKLVIP